MTNKPANSAGLLLGTAMMAWLAAIPCALGGSELEVRDTAFEFRSTFRDDTPNQYLVCPENYCATEADSISPVFDVPVAQLRDWWLIMVGNQPRIERLGSNFDIQQYNFVQRSELFRFPDFITVRFIPLDKNSSTLAIFSRSEHGYYDFGVNRARVESWLTALPRWVPPLTFENNPDPSGYQK